MQSAGLPITQTHTVFDKDSGCLNIPVTEEEKLLSISSMKTKSAPGVDCICSERFKCTANIVSEYLVGLFSENLNVVSFLIHEVKTSYHQFT